MIKKAYFLAWMQGMVLSAPSIYMQKGGRDNKSDY